MGMIDFFNKRVKKMDIIDLKLAQTTAMFATLIIVKFFPQDNGN